MVIAPGGIVLVVSNGKSSDVSIYRSMEDLIKSQFYPLAARTDNPLTKGIDKLKDLQAELDECIKQVTKDWSEDDETSVDEVLRSQRLSDQLKVRPLD